MIWTHHVGSSIYKRFMLHCRCIIPESNTGTSVSESNPNQLYANTSTLSAPQLSSSTTQTSPETDANNDDKTPLVSPRSVSEFDTSVGEKQVFKKPATPPGKTTKVGRFSIGPVKEIPVPSAGKVTQRLVVIMLIKYTSMFGKFIVFEV